MFCHDCFIILCFIIFLFYHSPTMLYKSPTIIQLIFLLSSVNIQLLHTFSQFYHHDKLWTYVCLFTLVRSFYLLLFFYICNTSYSIFFFITIPTPLLCSFFTFTYILHNIIHFSIYIHCPDIPCSYSYLTTHILSPMPW